MLFYLLVIVLNYFLVLHFTHAITEGYLATPGMFAYEVAIVEQQKFICGGTIISELWIVTTAHCFKRVSNATFIQVVVGVQTFNEKKFEDIKDVLGIKIHNRYSPTDRDFDIALLKLKEPLTFGQNVQKINLAMKDFGENGYEATAVGWGQVTDFADETLRLRHRNFRVWEHKQCNSLRIWGPSAYEMSVPLVSERMLCAGIPDGKPGTCKDDDGGALIVNNELVGILSWRYDCHTPKKPSVYTSIPSHYLWIKEYAQI